MSSIALVSKVNNKEYFLPYKSTKNGRVYTELLSTLLQNALQNIYKSNVYAQ
jgi:hypothetical protein